MRINGDVNKSEGMVWKYLMENEFNIIMGKMMSSELGIPDFKCVKGEYNFWCEVKSENDGIRPEQLQWFNKNKDQIILVATTNMAIKQIHFYKLIVSEVKLKDGKWE